MRRGTGEVGAAVAAGREDRHMRAEAMDRAVIELDGNHAAAAALVVYDQIDGEELDEELGGVAQRLPVHGMQHGVTGAIGRGAGALGDALPVMRGHAAEGTLINLSVVPAREWQPP